MTQKRGHLTNQVWMNQTPEGRAAQKLERGTRVAGGATQGPRAHEEYDIGMNCAGGIGAQQHLHECNGQGNEMDLVTVRHDALPRQELPVRHAPFKTRARPWMRKGWATSPWEHGHQEQRKQSRENPNATNPMEHGDDVEAQDVVSLMTNGAQVGYMVEEEMEDIVAELRAKLFRVRRANARKAKNLLKLMTACVRRGIRSKLPSLRQVSRAINTFIDNAWPQL